MNDQCVPNAPMRKTYQPQEFKVVSLRECPAPEEMLICETPEQAYEYWQSHIATASNFNPECECLVVLILNTRKRVKGHVLVSTGTLNSVLAHPREVFRVAILMAAASILLLHNHPSGEPDPSQSDIAVTREMKRAGEVLKIDILDHVIVGHNRHVSLRALGYLYP